MSGINDILGITSRAGWYFIIEPVVLKRPKLEIFCSRVFA
jgi:hypothetical protein